MNIPPLREGSRYTVNTLYAGSIVKKDGLYHIEYADFCLPILTIAESRDGSNAAMSVGVYRRKKKISVSPSPISRKEV